MSTLLKHKFNPCPVPTRGMEFDYEGPTADHLIRSDHIYGRVVYEDLHALLEEWELVDQDVANDYMPIRKEPLNVTTGIKEKTTHQLPTLESVNLASHFEYKRGYIINTGGSIWGLDFVPKHLQDADPTTQYLAVGGYRGSVEERIHAKEIQPTGTYKNAIQIWKLKLSVNEPAEDAILDMCLLHDFGVIHDLKWCPYGTYEDGEVDGGLAKLGVLSAVCGDGTVRLIVVPHPNAVRKHMCSENEDTKSTIYIRLTSARTTFETKGAKPLLIDWGSHKKIAVGYTDGRFSVWNVEGALADPESSLPEKARRYLMFSNLAADSCIRNISWHGIDDPDELVISSYDGQVSVFDMKDPNIPLQFFRGRGVHTCCCWAGHAIPVMYVDAEGIVKSNYFCQDGSSFCYKLGRMAGDPWAMATSEHHGHFLCFTSIGWLFSINLYQAKGKTQKPHQNMIYKLHYDDSTNTYQYFDGIGLLDMDKASTIPDYKKYSDIQMSIHKAVWNPNKRTSAFVASGGPAGLCRIDFEGRGPHWI